MAIDILPSDALVDPPRACRLAEPENTASAPNPPSDEFIEVVAEPDSDPLDGYDLNRDSLPLLARIIDQLQESHPEAADVIARNVADRRQIAAFVDALFRYVETGFVQFRCFIHPNGNEKTTWRYPWHGVSITDRETLIDRATEFASMAALADKRVVFAPPVVALKDPKSARNGDVLEGPVLSAECDDAPRKARETLTQRLGLPTCVVESGGEWTDPVTGEVQPKLHLHWRLTEPTRTQEDHDRLKLARDLAARLVGADTTAVPLVHPLRWPGSFHRKAAPRLARLVELNPDVEIELTEVLDLLQEAFEVTGQKVTPPAARVSGQLVADDPLDLTAAVAVLENPNLTWAKWNEIGMAIWAATEGSEAGRASWLSFSAKSTKSHDGDGRFDEAAAQERWAHYSTSPPTKIGAGTLFWLAAQACPGWRKPSSLARKAKDDSPWQVEMAEARAANAAATAANAEPRYRMTEAGLFYDREPPKPKGDDELASEGGRTSGRR